MHHHPVQGSIAAKDKIIVPLDVPTREASRSLINRVGGTIGFFKVGSQLFTATGPAIIEGIKASGSKIFLDLKFHDIPNTVRSAVESACSLRVDMLTIHLSGGSEMCQAAVKGRGVTSTQILGVTVLTSQTEATLSEIGIQRSLTHQVLSLAAIAKTTGVTGLIASPLELEPLRNEF